MTIQKLMDLALPNNLKTVISIYSKVIINIIRAIH